MLELDDIDMIYTLDYNTDRNHTMVLLKNGGCFCSCRLCLPSVFKSEPQLSVGNVSGD